MYCQNLVHFPTIFAFSFYTPALYVSLVVLVYDPVYDAIPIVFSSYERAIRFRDLKVQDIAGGRIRKERYILIS